MDLVSLVGNNLEWILLGFMVVEKIVRATPTKYDDIVFDMILKPIVESLKKPKKKETNATKQKSESTTKTDSTKH